MPTPFIELIDIHKNFAGNSVLDGVNLTIEKGMVTCIIGKSGTGKSVLLKHIIGLMQADSGTVCVDGLPTDEMDSVQRHRFYKQISYMFQDNALFDFLTVWENIALPLTEKKKIPMEQIRSRVKEKMQALEISSHENKYPAQLSGGIRKRVALARALITEPVAVLFDEPTTGLDPVRRNSVHAMISTYQKEFGFTAVIVSHDIPQIFTIAQHVAMLDQGKIIYFGKSEEISHSDNDTVRAFISGKEA
ncbi:ATP-binding cassette domain-containing protein [uncultured Desulfobacter sp.]|uniref:ABC transporter ATP-binding protein n=1 Tax=uncultured Desulfobacter sp. TaxID=240139 RepID=UPI002AAC3010|nr:ATP-binding cassette domain-containing protein [uncultured Desulfobacter sp.]